jgi:hypothetical protein
MVNQLQSSCEPIRNSDKSAEEHSSQLVAELSRRPLLPRHSHSDRRIPWVMDEN